MIGKKRDINLLGEINWFYFLLIGAIVILSLLLLFVMYPRPKQNLPPAADFTWSVGDLIGDNVEPRENDAVRFIDNSYDPDGQIVEWRWDFGDNFSSAERSPTHRYAVSGEYLVRLTVVDDRGKTGSKTKTLRVRPSGAPKAFFTFSPDSPTVLDTVHFLDASYDPDGQIVSWLWEFGDGAFSTSGSPSHIFQTAGDFRVALTVTDNDGKTGRYERIITVSLPSPESVLLIYWDGGLSENVEAPARYGFPNNGRHLSLAEAEGQGWESDPNRAWEFIYANISGGWAGFYCSFKGGPTDISEYENLVFWVKGGEGGEDFEIILEDAVGSGGKVRVSDYVQVSTSWRRVVIPLEAFGEDLRNVRVPWNIAFSDGVTGRDATVYVDYVALVRKRAVGGAPVAMFSYSPASPTTSDYIQFTDNSHDPDGYIVSWFWDFGDGTTSYERNPVHRYPAARNYTVRLTVTDNDGNSASFSLVISVVAPLPPPPPPPSGNVTLSGMPAALNVPLSGSTTVTEVLLSNGTAEAKTLKVVCDAWDASGHKLWSSIYTADGERVFVDGAVYPLTLGPGGSRHLRITVGAGAGASAGDSFVLHIMVEDY